MARIAEFVRVTRTRRGPLTEVTCGWQVHSNEYGALLFLDTYGSHEREKVGGVSQSIQLDESAALKLVGIIIQAFPAIAVKLRDRAD